MTTYRCQEDGNIIIVCDPEIGYTNVCEHHGATIDCSGKTVCHCKPLCAVSNQTGDQICLVCVEDNINGLFVHTSGFGYSIEVREVLDAALRSSILYFSQILLINNIYEIWYYRCLKVLLGVKFSLLKLQCKINFWRTVVKLWWSYSFLSFVRELMREATCEVLLVLFLNCVSPQKLGLLACIPLSESTAILVFDAYCFLICLWPIAMQTGPLLPVYFPIWARRRTISPHDLKCFSCRIWIQKHGVTPDAV